MSAVVIVEKELRALRALRALLEDSVCQLVRRLVNHLVALCICGFLLVPCRVGPSFRSSVCPSVQNIFQLRAVLALLLLPNRPRLDCRIPGLVVIFTLYYA